MSRETILRVLELKRRFSEISTNYVLAIKAGISPSSVGKIIFEYYGPRKKKKVPRKQYKTVEWLKKHVSWALDTIKIRCEEGYVYVQLLFEEYSRCVLGWIMSYSNTGEKAKMLLERVMNEQGVKPLVVKIDRGSEFQNDVVISYLKEKEILTMPSPGHYPLFNGKLERENQIFEKYLETEKGGLTYEKVYVKFERAIYEINHEMPRRIFDGKTSADVFETGEMYKNEEKQELIKKVEDAILEIEKQKIPGVDKLDVVRKAVVKCVVDMGLCSIKSGEQNVNQFAG